MYLGAAGEIPNVLREIGRLREVAFRQRARARDGRSISTASTATTGTSSPGITLAAKWWARTGWA
ncbi:MAG: hypothetical protein WDO73_07360 [Ignavibacteriota bacterium]